MARSPCPVGLCLRVPLACASASPCSSLLPDVDAGAVPGQPATVPRRCSVVLRAGGPGDNEPGRLASTLLDTNPVAAFWGVLVRAFPLQSLLP